MLGRVADGLREFEALGEDFVISPKRHPSTSAS
jgi:hypothetical protein